jgi:exonuclease III
MKILKFNVRELGLPEKRRIIQELTQKEHIDILCIQETKKKSFSTQFLKSISHFYVTWKFYPFRWCF